MSILMDELKQHWGAYIKIGAVIVAMLAWGFTFQSQWNLHTVEMRDSIKLLLLICKNSTPKIADKIECYNAIDRR